MMQPWIMIAALAAAQTQPDTPLAPSGKWIADYAEDMCVLQRSFGDGDSETTLGLRMLPLSPVVEVVLITSRSTRGRPQSGSMRITISEDKKPRTPQFTRVEDPQSGRRVTTFDLDGAAINALSNDAVITFAGNGNRVTLPMRGIVGGLKVLEPCIEDLVTRWGVSAAAREAIKTQNEPIAPESWIKYQDYPAEAVRSGRMGTVTILWSVGLDGRAGDCRVLRSSRHPDLDKATCDAILARARYKPALDKDGKPIASWSTRKVRWLMPGVP